jgi:Protein of unknown function (DUF4236)
MRTIYRKRLKFGLLRINLSRTGVGMSWGVRGFRVTHSATGRRYLTLSLPGTGLSWQRALGRSRRSIPPGSVITPPRPAPPLAAPCNPPNSNLLPPNQVNGLPWWNQPGLRRGP